MSCGDWNDFEDPPVTKEMSLDEFVQRLTAQIEATKARADLATRLLCGVLKEAQAQTPFWRVAWAPELVSWWEKHKELDAKRKKRTIRCGRKLRRRR